MLRFLASRESGIDPPLSLRRAESTRRAFSLELSRHRDVERLHRGGINSMDIDLVEGRYLISGGSDGTLVIHDLENFSGEVKHTAKAVCTVDRSHSYSHGFSVESVLWYPLDTGLFTSSGSDKLLKVWDTNKLIPVDEYTCRGNIYSHHMSPISTKHYLIAVGSRSPYVSLIDLKSGASTHLLKGHNGPVFSVRWSPKDEFLLASGSDDNQVLLWDIRSAKGHLMTMDQYNGEKASENISNHTAHNGSVNGLCFTSDGLHLLTFGTDDCLRLWNLSAGKNTLVNYGKVFNKSRKGVQFSVSSGCSPDLIFVPSKSNLEVFDIYTGLKIDTLRGHFTLVNCCLFNQIYQDLYSGGTDRNILVWGPEPDSAYDDHLKSKKGLEEEKTSFVKRIGATADTWSSDEED